MVMNNDPFGVKCCQMSAATVAFVHLSKYTVFHLYQDYQVSYIASSAVISLLLFDLHLVFTTC